VGYVKTEVFFPIYYADDMFRPLWVTKICIEVNYTEYDHSVGAYLNFQRDLFDGWIKNIELKAPLLSIRMDIYIYIIK